MAKILRKAYRIFGSTATAAAGGLEQFGGLAAGAVNYSVDVETLQALDAWVEGWNSACLGTNSPVLEERNAVDYVHGYQIGYLLQQGVPEWLSTQTYYQGNYCVDSNGDLRVSVIDNNTGNDPALDNGGQYWGFAGSSGAGKSIGEVFYSQSSSAVDNPGALPLFTGETIASADTLYPEFYNWVNTHTDLQISDADYDTAISTYGECPLYVIDTVNKTIRLPLLKNYVKMANTTDKITQSAAGLPSHTHDVQLPSCEQQSGTGYVVYGSDQPQNPYTYTSGPASNSIYGNSDTVTPAHTTLYPWVCAYSAAVQASVAQAAEFQNALSGKADTNLANITTSAGTVITSLAAPSATYDTLTLGVSGTSYTAPADGYFCFAGTTSVNLGAIILANQTTGFYAPMSRAQTGGTIGTFLPVRKGDIMGIAYDGISSLILFRFYYAEGSKSLA